DAEPASRETEGAEQRQLEYANGLFARKLYDLAIPEYQKYLEDYPGRAGRANAYFSLGECYRNLHRDSNARTNLQKVLTEYGDSEFAGPAAFALAEMAFTEKDYATALPLFHRSAAKSKEQAVALSARYFEARCLEALGKKDEAADIYAQVAFRRLQYQTGQYAQLLADYKKELEKLPEAAQAEVLLLAANSQRQLGHPKEAEALYRQITTKYPDREEAKDAAYQQLINVYNSDPSALSAAVDQFLATNPTNERADQAKLLKAEALYKQQNYTEAA